MNQLIQLSNPMVLTFRVDVTMLHRTAIHLRLIVATSAQTIPLIFHLGPYLFQNMAISMMMKGLYFVNLNQRRVTLYNIQIPNHHHLPSRIKCHLKIFCYKCMTPNVTLTSSVVHQHLTCMKKMTLLKSHLLKSHQKNI